MPLKPSSVDVDGLRPVQASLSLLLQKRRRSWECPSAFELSLPLTYANGGGTTTETQQIEHEDSTGGKKRVSDLRSYSQ